MSVNINDIDQSNIILNAMYISLTLFCCNYLYLTFASYCCEQLNKYSKTQAIFDERSSIDFNESPHLKDWLSFKDRMDTVPEKT